MRAHPSYVGGKKTLKCGYSGTDLLENAHG